MSQNGKPRPRRSAEKNEEPVSRSNPGAAIADRPAPEALQEAFGLTEKQAAFLTEFSKCGNVSEAARRSETCRRAHYDYLQTSKGYQAAFQQTLKAIGFRVVEKMAERALDGDLVLYQGEVVKDEDDEPLKRYDTVLQIFLSKVLAGMQETPPPREKQSSPQIHIHMPEQCPQPPVIECNQADTDNQSVDNANELRAYDE